MALNHKYTLVCDDVRREDNGKLIVVGLYTPGIVLAQFPLTLPKLMFLVCLEPTDKGSWKLDFRLTHLPTSALVGPTGRVDLNVPVVGSLTYLPIAIPNVQFQMPGDYAFMMTGANFDELTVNVPVQQRTSPKVP